MRDSRSEDGLKGWPATEPATCPFTTRPASNIGRTACAKEELGALEAPSPPMSGMKARRRQAISACAAVDAACTGLHRI